MPKNPIIPPTMIGYLQPTERKAEWVIEAVIPSNVKVETRAPNPMGNATNAFQKYLYFDFMAVSEINVADPPYSPPSPIPVTTLMSVMKTGPYYQRLASIYVL